MFLQILYIYLNVGLWLSGGVCYLHLGYVSSRPRNISPNNAGFIAIIMLLHRAVVRFTGELGSLLTKHDSRTLHKLLITR